MEYVRVLSLAQLFTHMCAHPSKRTRQKGRSKKTRPSKKTRDRVADHLKVYVYAKDLRAIQNS